MSPDLALEHFEDASLVFLAGPDRFITVNAAAASLLELIMAHYAGRSFSVQDLAVLLVKHYKLTGSKSLLKARALFESWLIEGLLVADRNSIEGGGSP